MKSNSEIADRNGLYSVPQASCVLYSMLYLLLFVVHASAATRYVDLNCTKPTSPYSSWETASTNIQMALKGVKNDDTVLVADGTYKISSQIVVNKALTIRSKNGAVSTIIDANSKCRVLYLKSKAGPITLDGFTITGGYADYNWNNGAGIAAVGKWPILIANCVIEENEAPGSGGGITASGMNEKTASVIIENCLIRNNRAWKHGGGVHIGMWNGASSPTSVYNCTIVGNSDGATGSGLSLVKGKELAVDGVTLANSIVYGNNGDEIRDVHGEIIITHSCLRNAPAGHGNIKRNPKFVDEGGGDFRLQPNSPCIEFGSNELSTQAADLDGNARKMDADQNGEAVVDMGAYEYVVFPVEIDIRPGSDSNVINPRERGLLPVAILATESFDITIVDPASIRFAGAKPERRQLEDVDEDGDADLLMLFQRQKLSLGNESTRALMTGKTKDKQPFIGQAPVEIVTAK